MATKLNKLSIVYWKHVASHLIIHIQNTILNKESYANQLNKESNANQ